jgi:hypothetical protein
MFLVFALFGMDGSAARGVGEGATTAEPGISPPAEPALSMPGVVMLSFLQPSRGVEHCRRITPYSEGIRFSSQGCIPSQ